MAISSSEHIFISYKREDTTLANAVRLALKSEGFEVWWDETLQTGERWEERIDEALLTAAAVVVLWTPASITSDWVRHEASVAKIRGVLAHAVMDDVEIPAPFQAIQTAQLAQWNQREDDLQFQKLVAAIKSIAEKQLEDTLTAELAIAEEAEKRKRWTFVAGLIAFLLGGAIGGYGGLTYGPAMFPEFELIVGHGPAAVPLFEDPRPRLGGPPTSSDLRQIIHDANPSDLTRLRGLIREYRLVARVHTWAGNRQDAQAVLRELQAGFADPVLLQKDTVEMMLHLAAEAFRNFKARPINPGDLDHEGYAHVRTVLAPVLRYTSITAYEDEIFGYPHDLYSALIYTEARSARAEDEDHLVQLLIHGENPSWALPILESMITGPSNPHRDTIELARQALGSDFNAWYFHVRGRSLADERAASATGG